jgi:hypothetical protein
MTDREPVEVTPEPELGWRITDLGGSTRREISPALQVPPTSSAPLPSPDEPAACER